MGLINMVRGYNTRLWGILSLIVAAIGIDQTTDLLNPPRDPSDWSGLGVPRNPPGLQFTLDDLADLVVPEVPQRAPLTGGGGAVLTALPRVAPLKIETSRGADYFVKIIDVPSGQAIMSFYIRGGEPWETYVPLGTYRVRYASGKREQWQGINTLFGKHTVTSEADRDLAFYEEADGISGYTIRLVLQSGGNLRTRRIPTNRF